MPAKTQVGKKPSLSSTDNKKAADQQKTEQQKAQEKEQLNKPKTNANSASLAGNKSKFGYGGTAEKTDTDQDDGDKVADKTSCGIM